MRIDTCIRSVWCVMVLATLSGVGVGWLGSPSQALAVQDAQGKSATVYLADGRVLSGVILKETSSYILFEYKPEGLSFSAQMELQKSEIVKIERHGSTDSESTTTESGSPTDTAGESSGTSSASATSDESVALFYVIPLQGQMNTDIRSEVYEDVVEEILALEKKPDILIFKLKSEDKNETMRAALWGGYDPSEWSMLNMDDSEALLRHFRIGPLSDIRQVVWIEDAVGTSSLLAMGWDEIYMMPEARLGGMVEVLKQTGAWAWPDSQVRAKMMAAWLGHARAHFEYGGQSLELADAMLDPSYLLTATWNGRSVQWNLNKPGEYSVDLNPQATTQFSAEGAENFCLSSGTAESLDDLALLLNYREYEEYDGIAQSKVESYIESWRKVLEASEDLWLEYQDLRSWATGGDTLMYLGQARTVLVKILRNMKKYHAVEIRLARGLGITPTYLEDQIAIIDEQLKSLRGQGGASGGGGTGGYTSGGGGGNR